MSSSRPTHYQPLLYRTLTPNIKTTMRPPSTSTLQLQTTTRSPNTGSLIRISHENCKKIHKLNQQLRQQRQQYKLYLQQNQPDESHWQIQTFDQIAQGLESIVYKARNTQTGQHFALKKIRLTTNSLSREEGICKALQNPFIVKIVDVFRKGQPEQEELNILMKLYKWDLQDYTNTCQQIDRLSLKLLLYQMARAVHYLHSKKICHRDIRPSNFLLERNGRLCLTDFGSAKHQKTNTTSVTYIGSRPYRAPQLLMGCTQYGLGVDIWSLGCIALQLATRKKVFDGSSTTDTLLSIARFLGTASLKKIRGDDENPSNTLPNINGHGLQELIPEEDEELLSLLSKMLVIDPKKRCTSVQIISHQFFDELRDEQVYQELLQKQMDISYFFDFSARNSPFTQYSCAIATSTAPD